MVVVVYTLVLLPLLLHRSDHGRHSGSTSQGIDAIDDATPPSRDPFHDYLPCALAAVGQTASLFILGRSHARIHVVLGSRRPKAGDRRELGCGCFSAACDMRRRCQDYPWKRVSLVAARHLCDGGRGSLDRRNRRTRAETMGPPVGV
ncbi:hypothetical protein B0T18DRAFT_187377 [Schizothecium vesticola]|uniref:Secreted protein n=1 Tax=Schizothecium vesticola TaxID=314040 RepID=A0AA40EQI8_9PEZI|nr:hypothetical protein B0T18DRAFT_187377 [Schizothecium vesticola]